MSTWSTPLPRIRDGISTFSANCINPIIDAMDARTIDLKNSIDSLGGSRGLIYTDTGFDATCQKTGTLVAWDTASNKYTAAYAAWSDTVRNDGSLVPASASYVIGVMLTDVDAVTGSATILRHGWISENPGLIDILAPNRTTGAYYLDSDGKAIAGTERMPAVPIYCYTYVGTGTQGKILFDPRPPEYAGHSHGRHILNNTKWSRCTATDIIPPELFEGKPQTTVYYKYTILSETEANNTAEDEALAACLLAGVSNATLVKNGIAVKHTDWCVDAANGYIFTAFPVLSTGTTADNIVLYVISPIISSDPLVHSVKMRKGSTFMTATNTDGNVILDLATAQEDNNPTGQCVSYLGRDGYKYAPVVHGIYNGPGMSVTPYLDPDGNTVPGYITLTNKYISSSLIDMNTANLDGVLFGSTTNPVCYLFPSGITSSVTGTFRVPSFGNTQVRPKIKMLIQGNSGLLSSLKVSVIVQKMPSGSDTGVSAGSGSTIHVNTTATMPTLYTEASNTDEQLCYVACADLFTTTSGGTTISSVTSDALIRCTVTATNPNTAITVHSISLQIDADN